jgi:uncharacterized protein
MAKELINRQRYLDEALQFRDTDLIKVITGVRRCGKSSLLELIRNKIEAEGIKGRAFASLNLESMENEVNTVKELYTYFKNRLSKNGTTYIFLDEPQRIEGWQDAVNAMRVDFNCDIYLTGSNAYLLSSELSTYLSGRYVEIKMLPLSLSEYLDFCGIHFAPNKNVALDESGEPVLFDDLLRRYMEFGGMPGIASLDINQSMHSSYISGMYEAIASRDIVNRERNKNESKVTDPELLRNVADYLADNIGNQTSSSKIANALTSAGRKISHPTAASYISALNEAYLFYRTTRYDLHGKAILRTSPKEYIVDLGLRSFLAGYRMSDVGRVFENAVYLELLYRGYSVHVGKIYSKEIDFVAIKDNQRIYIQVADEMSSEETLQREVAPLVTLQEAFPKMIIVRSGSYPTDVNGIRIVGARDFFLGDTLS